MANYSYSGLSVSVSADTRALTSQIATASRTAGTKASANLSGEITRGLGGVAKSGARAIGSIAAIGTGAMVAFAGSAIKAGVAYNVLYSSSLKAFTTILGSQKAAQKMMSDIEKFGKTSPFPRQAFIKASQQMLAFGYQAKDIIPTLNAVQDAVAATGGTADDINGIVTVLAKVKSSGKITAETLNQLGDRGVNAAELIGKGMGKSAGDIRSEITAGSLDANKALSVLTVQMEAKYKGAAAGLKSTWTGAKDSIHGAMRDIGSAIVEPFISKKGGGLAIEWANKLSGALWDIKPAVTPLVNALMQSLAPAINTVNTGVNWLIAQIGTLTNPKNLPAATAWVKKFGATALGVFGAGSAIAGGAFLTQLPLIGPIVEGLLGPFKALAGLFGDIGGKLAKGTLVKLIPQMKGLLGVSDEAAAVLPALSAPVLAVVAAFALLMVASTKFRNAVISFAKTLIVALKPIFGALVMGVMTIVPYIMQLGKVLGDNLAPIVAKLTPLLIPLGKIIGTVLAVAFKILGVYLKIDVMVLSWIINLLGTVLLAALNKVLPPIQAVVTWLAYKFGPALQAVANVAAPILASIGRWFAATFNTIKAVVLSVWAAVSAATMAALGWLVSTVTGVWAAIVTITQTVWNVIVNVIRVAWAVIVTAIQIYMIIVKAIILLWWTVVSAITQAIWSVIGQYVIAVWNWILSVARVVWAAIAAAVSAVWLVIQVAVTAALGWLQGTIGAVWNWVLGFTGVVWGAISAAIIGPLNLIRAAVGSALGWLKSVITASWAFIQAVTTAMWGAISNAIGAAWNVIKSIVNLAVGWIKAFINAEWNGILIISRAIWGVIGGTVMAVWNTIKAGIGAALGWIKNTMAGAWNSAYGVVKDVWGKIGGFIGNIWKTIKDNVGKSAGQVIQAMKDGFTNALKDISNWIKKNIVDPIVNAVKSHFGIPTGGGGGKPKGKSAGAQMAAAGTGQAGGGGGAGVTGLAAHAAGDGGGGGGGSGNWLGLLPQMLVNIARQAVTSDPLAVAKHIFGDVSQALGWIVVKGYAAIESLGKNALSALMKVPGLSDVLGMFGGVISGIGHFFGGLFGGGGGGGGGIAGLVNRAMSFNGHRYVWGGNADPNTGFDCSSFVNMLAMKQGLPIPGGFSSNKAHGPVTGNWLTFGGMRTVSWDQMMPGDIYVNSHHMGIVTGKGRGFAARSTATGTGPQSVPKGAYTIRRWPGGGGAGGGAGGNQSLLAAALQGMLTNKYGNQAVAMSATSGGSTANLVTIARYLATHGWSAAGAAGVAGNVYQESKGDPLASGTGGRGLIGWTPPNRLPNSAFIPGNPSASLSRQIPLVDRFFRQNMGRYWNLANSQKDPGRAALVIMNMGERPAGSSQSNPFFGGSGTSRGSLRASIARDIYNRLRAGGGIRMAAGGVVREPIAGVGRYSGRTYQIGEAGAERVSPLLSGGVTAEESRMLATLRARGSAAVINVYPRESQSETEIAAAVSRELGWAAAGGGAQ